MANAHRRWVMRNGELVELDLDKPLPPRLGPYIVSDLGEYRSVITREMITSRSQHRDHLRRHGCIEVGNEMPQPRREMTPSAREDIRAALQASPEKHAEARAGAERARAAANEAQEMTS